MTNPVRIALEIKGPRQPSYQQELLQSVMVALDDVLELDDAGIKCAQAAISEELATHLDKMETARKRIAYLEGKQPKLRKTGPKPKAAQ